MQLGTGQGALSCATTLALVSGAPVLFDVALDADFSLGAFLAQCLTGNGANWLVGFIDLALLSGTRTYYYDQAADDSAHSHSTLDGITFQPGFNVDAQIRLTQVTSITLHGVLTVRTDQTTGAHIGVQGGIQIDNPLDLVFAQIASTTQTAPGQPYTGGPLLASETGPQTTFRLRAGINFLGSA